jgi:hypothetical protein
MQRAIFSLILPLILLLGSPASAATLTTSSSNHGKLTVTLTGEITKGDSDALKTIIRKANDSGRLVGLVQLHSPGGSILEGVKLANMIRFGKIATSVIGTSQCASACFIVFAAGTEKHASYTASVGVHGVSDESGQETVEAGAATVTIARIAKELGVPPSIIGKMVVTPPEQMVWLTPDDLRSMGTTMTGKPAQVPAEPPSTSQLSPQLRPQDKSMASPAAPPPTWEELLDKAIELSTKQHGGNPEIGRECQPEFKECINALSFKANDGTDMIMKVTKDMNGKMLIREICSFNKYRDVRSCADWDTGKTHRDMKNKSGEWYAVDDQQ